ncbi:MAG: hypothetical protein KDA57_05270 [Planctomycetales bacterium]|nr:hypothetical protein [Planctomycetales bacterium]
MLTVCRRNALATLVVLAFCGGHAANADETLEALLNDAEEGWAEPVSILLDEQRIPEPGDEQPGDISLTQMLTPQRDTSRLAQRQQRFFRTTSPTGRASVPFMIGDTGAGTCVSLSGLIVDADLAHPTLTCSRLNIAENNTPLPTDRFFFSYRHFHNSTPARFFQYSKDFDVNRFTVGGERTFGNGLFSLEVRVPMEGRLSSNMLSRDRSLYAGPTEPFAGGQAAEFGNISGVFKALLHESENFALSFGLGATLPTAQDVVYDVDLLSTVTYTGFPAFYSERDALLDFEIKNETAYLSPFLAWLWQPNSRFFHQGFCQVEVGVNPSNLRATGGAINNFYDTGTDAYIATSESYVLFPGRARINPQTLMRLNLGIGYLMCDNPNADWIQRLTGLFEVHYTATLEDAENETLYFIDDLYGPGPTYLGTFSTPIGVGNPAINSNIVNLVAGVTANMGNWVVTNGVAAPIRTGSDRGFDFEYNLQIQRPF